MREPVAAEGGSKVGEARRRLEEIVRKAEMRGCSEVDVGLLPGAKRLLGRGRGEWGRGGGGNGGEKAGSGSGCRVLVVVFGVLAALVCASDVYTLEGFSSFWLRWNYGSVKDRLCTIPMPDELSKIFRPPVSCSMCQGVKEVEKVSKLPPELFEERYAYTGRPVVVTDGMTNWTAQHVFSFDFFKKIYNKRMPQWRLHNCQFFPYQTDFRHLGEVFNMTEERAFHPSGPDQWYVGWSNCDDEINQILRRHYQKPYFLPETAETKKLDWIFMGSSGYGAPMHVDNVEHPSWQAQLRGKKKWSLQPPPECAYDCTSVEVVVEAGEIIVLDTNRWYHSTLIVSQEMSITIGAEYD